MHSLPLKRLSSKLSLSSVRKQFNTIPNHDDSDHSYYQSDIHDIVTKFNSDVSIGLTSSVASEYLSQHGLNQFGHTSGPSVFKLLFSSIFNAMNAILLIALLIAFIANDYIEGIVLLIIIFTNSFLSFRQEYKSEKTMDALRKLSADTASVIRDGILLDLDATLLVPGDLVLLEEGNHVPADIRLFESINLSTNEALLTGEPVPIRKHINVISDITPLGDRKNMVYKSTTIAYGRGKGIVVATGIHTEIGKIAQAVNTGMNQTTLTPLERTMRSFMFCCLLVAILLGIIVFWVNHWHVTDPQVLLYAIATAVAILPEGLPAVTTVAMARGVTNMAKEKAIVRKLVSLELLGMITDLCTDKTGTLTEGRMSLVSAWLYGSNVTITGSFNQQGHIHSDLSDSLLKLFLQLCGLCNTCSVSIDPDTNLYRGAGDTTEIALAVVAHRHGFSKDTIIDKTHTFYAEYPFDSTIKRMSVIYQDIKDKSNQSSFIMYTKGALESVLPLCTKYIDHAGTEIDLTTDYSEHTIIPTALEMAHQGLRVLCVAIGYINNPSSVLMKLQNVEYRNEMENQLLFIGLIGIQDPPRVETNKAINDCISAGIQVRMVTGDHSATATAIARQIGILPITATPGSTLTNELVMTATQFDTLTDEQLDQLPELPYVIARCSPETKVKMVQALHRRNKCVSMTGDGINDAPSIAYADVGISMGLNGADVTKQASAITLTDDNFATIVKAIAQGRCIYANIVKFTSHLLSGNVSEVVALIIGLAMADGYSNPIFPMSPLQVLWLNLVTSTPIALALAMESTSPKLMKMKPRTTGVFTNEFIIDTVTHGCIMGGLTLISFYLVAYIHSDIPLSQLYPPEGISCNNTYITECDVIFRARGVSFITLSIMLLVHGLNVRNSRRSLFYYKWKEAKVLLYTIILGIILVIPLPYIPIINHDVFFHAGFTYEWGYVIGFCIIFIIIAELYKLIKRRALPKVSVDKIVHHYNDEETTLSMV